MKRKILSAILSVVMLISLVPALSPTVSASTGGHSAEEGAAWACARADEHWAQDVDNTAGVQCVDLIRAYYSYLGNAQVRGNGYEYEWNDLPSGWWRDHTPSIGAVAVWGKNKDIAGGYGHVGIVVSINGSKFTCVETKGSEPRYADYRERNVNGPTCYIHPDFSGASHEADAKAELDLFGHLDGRDAVNIEGYGTADIYINGNLIESNCSSYRIAWPIGTKYEIKNIQANPGYMFTGLYPGSKPLSGTIGPEGAKVILSFMREKPLVSVADRTYRIVYAQDRSKALDVDKCSSEEGTNIQLWDKNETAAQIFRITKNGQYYRIDNAASGMSIDVTGTSCASSVNVELYTPNTSAAQQWRFLDAGNACVYIQSAVGTVIDVTGGGTDSGTNIQMYHLNETDAQKWILEPFEVQPTPAVSNTQTVPSGRYTLVNAGSRYTMNYASSGWKGLSYKPICMSYDDGSQEQVFDLQYLGNGQYAIAITHSDGGVVNVWRSGGSAQAGDPITQSSSSGSQYQKFYITPVGGGYILQSASDTNKVIAVPTNEWHALLQIADYNAYDSKQIWRLTPTTASLFATGIQLNKTALSLTEGTSETLTATVLPANATDKSVTWSSSDTSVATVSSGKVTAVAKGTATITASAGGKSASCTVTVAEKVIPATSVTLNKTTLTLTAGESETLTATVAPSNATNKNVTWVSSDSGIAAVSGGKVTAVKAGTATITATVGGKSASCTVTVKAATVAVQSLSLNNTTLALAVGDSTTLTATVNPSNATDKTMTWSSSNTNVATVSNGKVTAVAKGTATITASAGGKSASCTVTVTEKVIPATSVTLSETTLTLIAGESETLTATVAPSNATDKDVTWVSNDSGIAAVSGGRVTAVNAGTATITAACGDVSASCTVTVKEKLVAPTITTENLSSGAVGKSYQATLVATGTAPISWSISSGALPAGLTLEDSTGAISGTPTKAGSFSFTVTAKNSAGEAQKSFSMAVSETAVTLSFETNGGSAIQNISCAKGSVVYLSNYTTTREGYNFTGWYSDSALNTPVSQLTVNADTTFYAGWKEKPAQPTGGSDVHFEKATIYYQDQFTDVPANQWYTNSVAGAFEYGLMKGNSDTTFNPYGDVTIAEAVTMAARIHSIYMTGAENFDQGVGGAWYQVYLDYALENGIISNAYYTSDVSGKATRAQFAEIFARSLPAEALPAVNDVANGAVPDVAMSADYAEFVYLLYRAGILTGSDSNGTFYPTTYITRAEAAAIVSRMAESSNRVSSSLDSVAADAHRYEFIVDV